MASSLTDLAIAVGYPQLLHIDGGVTSSLASVYDGDGTATPLKISTTAVQIIDGSYDFDIASHDGTNGLKLGGTLVTATAAEINALSGLTINSTQLNYLDITTLGTAEASKAVTTDANVDITGLRNITGTGTATFANFVASGDTTIGDGDTDNITINADINSNLIPNVDNSFDLGTSSKQWKDLYLNGVAYVDSVDLEGDILLKAQGDVRFYDSDSSNYVALQSPGTIASNYTLSLPDADGSNKQLLRTDGAGALSFAFADRLNQPARNVSGSTISAGTPVYVTGYNSGENRVTIAPSDASDSATMPAIGVTTADISNNANGEISITGIVESIDTSSFSVGDTLYVANGGGLTATKPTGTYLIQNIAHVLRSHASAGEIQVISTYRTNDLPNIAEDAVWIGNSSGVPTATDFDTVLSTRLATTSVKGIASFSSDNFAVSSGVVTIKDNGVALATETTGDFVNSITGGTGIDSTGATSGENISHTLSLNLNELTTETTIADADFIAMVDATDNGSGKITFENLEDAIFASVSGDINIAEDGTATIQANSVALATDTTGDFVASITAGTGLTSTGATSGENIAHSLSVDASQTQITAVGALGTGSISSGFGNIDIGSSDLTATGTVSLGASSFNDNNITNVGDIALDSISADGSTINVAIGDNTSDVFTIKQSTNRYFAIDTSDTAENIAIGTGVSGTAISIGHSTSTTTVNDDLIVTGDLTVNGATTTLNTTNSVISDTLIELGNGTTGTPANDSGIVIERGDSNNAFLGFDESDDKFIVGTGTFTGASTGSLTITTGTLKANIEGSLDVSSSTLTTSAAQNLAIMQGANSNVDIGAFEMRASTFESDVATGTAPIVVASTTKVANLNADLLDDQTGSYYLDFSNFVVDDNEISGDKINGGTIDSITIDALAGQLSLGGNNIINIGSVSLGTLQSSATDAGFTVALVDNVDPAIEFKEATNLYMKLVTTNGSEGIEFHKPIDFGVNVGTMNFNSNNMTNVDIDSGTIDGTTIGASSASTGAFTTISASDAVTFAKSTNSDYKAKIYNANAGTATESNIYITNSSSDADGLFAGVGGTGFTTAGGFVQDGAWIGSGTGASGGLSLMTRASADMRFYTNGHTNLALTIDSSQNSTFAGTITANSGSKITSSSADTTFSIETTSGTTIFPVLDFVSSHSSVGAKIRQDGADVITIDNDQDVTFADDITVSGNSLFSGQANFGTTASFIKQSRFGYSSSYKVLQLGLATSTSAISLGADISGNSSGGFTGNEILIPNARGILAPNNANNAFLGVLAVTSSDTIEIGRGNHSIVNTSGNAISINTSTNHVSLSGGQADHSTLGIHTVGTNTYSATGGTHHTDSAITIDFPNSDQSFGAIRWRSHGAMEQFFGVVQQGSSGQGDWVWQNYDGSSYGERLRILGGGGITFNGDTATANALDDYEEGTWTPLIKDTSDNAVTNSSASGKFIKVGHLCHAQFDFTVSSLGSASGSVVITGLPFTSKDFGGNAGRAGASFGFGASLSITAGTNIAGFVETNATWIVLTEWTASTGTEYVQAGDISTGGRLIGSVMYITA